MISPVPSPLFFSQVVAVVENIVQASNITINGGADVANSAEFNQIMRFVKVGALSRFKFVGPSSELTPAITIALDTFFRTRVLGSPCKVLARCLLLSQKSMIPDIHSESNI